MLRKSMRKTFYKKKKLSKWGLEPGPILAKFIFSNFFYVKILINFFEKIIFTHEGEKRGEFFDEK